MERVADGITQIECMPLQFQLAGLDLGKVQDVIEHRHQRVGGLPHQVEVAPLVGGHRGVEQQLSHADHAVHWRANLMAHVRQEGALGPVRRFCRLTCLPQIILDLDAQGNVACRRVDGGLVRVRRSGPFDPQVTAVLMLVAVDEIDQVLPGAQLRHRCHGFGTVFRVNEIHKRLVQQLRLGVTQHGPEGGVDALEVAVHAGDAQHVQRHLEKRPQAAAGFLGLALRPHQLVLHPLPQGQLLLQFLLGLLQILH